MPLKLMYITNSEDVAHIAEEAGVDRIFDMDYNLYRIDQRITPQGERWKSRTDESLYEKDGCAAGSDDV